MLKQTLIATLLALSLAACAASPSNVGADRPSPNAHDMTPGNNLPHDGEVE